MFNSLSNGDKVIIFEIRDLSGNKVGSGKLSDPKVPDPNHPKHSGSIQLDITLFGKKSSARLPFNATTNGAEIPGIPLRLTAGDKRGSMEGAELTYVLKWELADK